MHKTSRTYFTVRVGVSATEVLNHLDYLHMKTVHMETVVLRKSNVVTPCSNTCRSPFKDFATEVGYLVDGKCNTIGGISKGLWNIFLNNKKCLKCEVPHETEYNRPFCTNCYRSIKNVCT